MVKYIEEGVSVFMKEKKMILTFVFLQICIFSLLLELAKLKVQGVTKRMDSLTYYIMLGGLILFWPPCRISQIMIFNHFLQGLSTQS